MKAAGHLHCSESTKKAYKLLVINGESR